MNNNFYPVPPNGHYYDPRPSTSGCTPFLPMQQLNNMPSMPVRNPQVARHERQAHLDSWMSQHPHIRNGFYNPSPAHSVRSNHSVMSAGSVMSAFSHLSINTNFTEYSTMPTWNMISSMGTENIYPVPQVHWTAKDVEAEVRHVITILKNVELVNYDPQHIKDVFHRLNRLIFDQSGKEAQANVPVPLDCVCDGTKKELLGAIFGSLTFNENTMKQLDPKMKTFWNQQVNRTLKYLFYIYRRVSNQGGVDKFDEYIAQLPGKPIHILASFLTPNKEYTYYAVKIFYVLVRASSLRVKKLRISELSRDHTCIDNLVRIVCPDQEYMNQMERQLALDCISSFARNERCQQRLIQSNFIPELLKRYFVPNVEEQVLYKIPQLLLKLYTKAGIRQQLRQQMESVRAFALIGNMLSHGSPRVLLDCLTFLASLQSDIQNISDLDKLTAATLKLIGSTEVQITKAALMFLYIAERNNPLVKANITKQNGVLSILACLRQDYYSSQNPSTTQPQIIQEIREIKTIGMKIILSLVRAPEITASDYQANPENGAAQSQAASYTYLPELICNWMSENRDAGRLTMVRSLMEILTRCSPEDKNRILSTKVTLDDQSAELCAAESLVGCLFTMYLNHDTIYMQNMKEAETMQDLSSRLLLLFWKILTCPGSAILCKYLGCSSPPQHNLINLFMESVSTQHIGMRERLLEFMAAIANQGHLSQLIFAWAKHPQFEAVMTAFSLSQNPGCVIWTRQILAVVQVHPLVN